MANGKDFRVLVAEDDEATRLLLDRQLREQGFSVQLAADGHQALAIATGPSPPQIMLLDWVLPGIDGLDICREVRSGGSPGAYILVVTAKTEAEDLLCALEAGANDFLSKPFEPDQLTARMNIARAVIAETTLPSNEVLETLFDALDDGNGEVVIRDGSQVARIHVQNHQISWVSLTSDTDSILGFLEANANLGNDEARAVVEECRRSRRNTPDVLADWGLIASQTLRDLLLSSIRQRLGLVVRQSRAVALFLPRTAPHPSQFTFALRDLLPDIAALHSLRTREATSDPSMSDGDIATKKPSLEELEQFLQVRTETWKGLEIWTVFDASTRRPVLGSERRLPRDLVTAYATLLEAFRNADPPIETLVSTGNFVDVVATIPAYSPLFLFTRFHAREVKLGLARQRVSSLLGEWSSFKLVP